MLRIHPESLATIVDQVPPVPPWVGMQLQQHKNGMFDVCLTWTGWLTYLVLLGDIFPVFFSLTISSPSLELERLCKLHLTLIPTLQQSHLVNTCVSKTKYSLSVDSPVGEHESRGHKRDWLSRPPARGQQGRQVARGRSETCRTARGSPGADQGGGNTFTFRLGVLKGQSMVV